MKHSQTTHRELIWNFLAGQQSPMTSSEIAIKMGMSQAIVSSNLSAMFKLNQVSRESERRYNDNAMAYMTWLYKAIGTSYVHRVPKGKAARRMPIHTTAAEAAPKPAPAPKPVQVIPQTDAAADYKEFLEYKEFMAFKKMKASLR